MFKHTNSGMYSNKTALSSKFMMLSSPFSLFSIFLPSTLPSIFFQCVLLFFFSSRYTRMYTYMYIENMYMYWIHMCPWYVNGSVTFNVFA
ncbi:hypothetical protein VNO77_39338 [Canavalia gladiata]|uniref:Uncharacterized protein n=1 Tax=Canavalia gladiata TaxID=3824 RepID=A0AAN9KAX3_CANGL